MINYSAENAKLIGFLSDTGLFLKLAAFETKAARDAAASPEDKNYLNGKLFGYMSVLSFLQQQAVAFEIETKILSLDGIDPEQDLA